MIEDLLIQPGGIGFVVVVVNGRDCSDGEWTITGKTVAEFETREEAEGYVRGATG